jgi:hypothetical protein
MMAKGGKFERQISRELSLWWTQDLPDGPRDDIFWRTAGSGGRATYRKTKGKSTYNSHGDIAALDPIGNDLLKVVAFELKKGYSFDHLHAVLDNPPDGAVPTYIRWVEQAEISMEGANSLYWMIITKRDRREALIIIPYLFYVCAVTLVPELEPSNRGDIQYGKRRVVAFQMKDFFKKLKPHHYHTILGNKK